MVPWLRALAVAIPMAALGLWVLGLVRFAEMIPRTVEDTTTHTDAIIVLTGGSERLTTGLRLLDEDQAPLAFVSGVHPSLDADALVERLDPEATPLASRVQIGHGARDTSGNATETADWVRAHGVKSLRLVTASYHMPRSLLEFHHALPDVRVIPHPVFPPHVHQDTWWRSPGTAALIISEYHKYLWVWLRQTLSAAFGAEASAPARAP